VKEGGVEAICGDGSGTFHHDKAIARAITNLRLRNASAEGVEGSIGFGAWRPEALVQILSQPTMPSLRHRIRLKRVHLQP